MSYLQFIILSSIISYLFSIYHSGARETDFTNHSVWSHDGHVFMEKASHLRLITMGLLQTCGYITEQMETKVTIDVNKFLEAFSIEVDGSLIHPPLWSQEQDPISNGPGPIAPIQQASTSLSSSTSTSNFNMDDYRICRQEEAIRWINLQESRSSIIPRLQPTTALQYQLLRDAVMSDHGPFCRTVKSTKGICTNVRLPMI